MTKTGSVVLGTGLTAAAISSELYVVNEETVLAAGFIIIVAFIAKSIRAPYKEWAEGHINVCILSATSVCSISDRNVYRKSKISSNPHAPNTPKPSHPALTLWVK